MYGSTRVCGDAKVLIKPYWNINFDNSKDTISIDKVLIKPYWNINVGRLKGYYNHNESINQTILEYKF